MNQVLCGARIQTLIFLSPAPTTVHVGAEHTLRPTQDPSQKQLKSPVFPQNSSFAFFITCSVKAKWMKINEGLSGTKIQECASTNFSGHRDMSVIQVEVKGKGTAFFQRERLLSQMHSFIGQINMSSAAPPPPPYVLALQALKLRMGSVLPSWSFHSTSQTLGPLIQSQNEQ